MHKIEIVESQMILKCLGEKKTKRSKQDSQNRQMSHVRQIKNQNVMTNAVLGIRKTYRFDVYYFTRACILGTYCFNLTVCLVLTLIVIASVPFVAHYRDCN
jgi:hypothetical protein